MTRRTDCERYPECLENAARADGEVRCDLCGNYIHTEPQLTDGDVAGILRLLVFVLNPQAAERLPADGKWKWDLLQLACGGRERSIRSDARLPAGLPAL